MSKRSELLTELGDDDLEELVTVYPPYKAPGTLITGDIGRVPGNKVTYELVDRVVSLLLERVQNIRHERLDVCISIP